MNTFKNKDSLRTVGAEIVQKLKNNEARPKFTGSYKNKACISDQVELLMPVAWLRNSKVSCAAVCIFSKMT